MNKLGWGAANGAVTWKAGPLTVIGPRNPALGGEVTAFAPFAGTPDVFLGGVATV
jgi:hypothetical protein